MVDYLYNCLQTLIKCIRKKIYLIIPIISSIIFCVLVSTGNIVSNDFNVKSDIIGVSGTLAGFLFSSLGIIIALPRNNFISKISSSGHMLIIIKTIIGGIIFFILSIITSIFTNYMLLIKIIFIMGLSEFTVALYQFSQIIKFSNKSDS